MDLDLLMARRWFGSRTTIGEVYVNGAYQCYSLEDVVRPAGQKVKGKTAIPAGIYRVVLDFSPKFSPKRFAYLDQYHPQRLKQKGWRTAQEVPIPHILAVRDFDQVRMHWGNDELDTEGCVLMGSSKDLNAQTVGDSRDAFEKLMDHLELAQQNNYHITLEITPPDKDEEGRPC